MKFLLFLLSAILLLGLSAGAAEKEADAAGCDFLQFGFCPGIPESTQTYSTGIRLGAPMSNGAPVYGAEVSVLYAGSSKVYGFQGSLITASAQQISGLQLSLVNFVNTCAGLQLGIINFADKETFQIGILNFVKDGALKVCPVINFKF